MRPHVQADVAVRARAFLRRGVSQTMSRAPSAHRRRTGCCLLPSPSVAPWSGVLLPPLFGCTSGDGSPRADGEMTAVARVMECNYASPARVASCHVSVAVAGRHAWRHVMSAWRFFFFFSSGGRRIHTNIRARIHTSSWRSRGAGRHSTAPGKQAVCAHGG